MGFSVVSRPLARPAGLGLVLAGFIAGVAVQLQQSALWPGGAGCCHSVQPVWLEGLDSIEKPGAAQHGPAGSAGSAGGPLAGRWLDRLAGQRFSSVRAEPGAGRTRYCRHGYVAAMPQIGEDAVRFRLGIESARLNGHAVTLPPQLLLGWYSGFAGRETKSSSVESSDTSELALELQRKAAVAPPRRALADDGAAQGAARQQQSPWL